MNNLFEISPEEKARIRQLHESYKNVHGTTSLLTEQVTRTLQGTVKDSETKEPLLGTNIFVTERKGVKQAGTTSDRQGKFKLTGIKPGETVTMSYIGYTNNVINSTTIDTKNGIDEEFLLIPGNELGEVNIQDKRTEVQGCMHPAAINFDEKNWIDCKGTKFDIKYNVDPKTKESELVVNFDETDKSCCEYYYGCMDPVAENYWEKVSSFVKLKEEQPEKEIRDCKNNPNKDLRGCCKYIDGCMDENAVNYNEKATKDDGSCKAHTEGCLDAAALNYNPKATKPCLDENEDGKPDCCKYPKGHRSVETIKKNFQTYYDDNLIGQTINAYTTIEGRNAQEIDELYGNYKIDNVIPTRISKGDKTYGYSIPLQPDTEALRRKIQKCSTITREKRKIKCKKEVEELRKATASLVIKFDETFMSTLQSIINVRDTVGIDDIAKLYIRPRGSKKMGKEVYVGPKDFLTDEAQNLISFLKAYNEELGKVPGTSM